MIRLALAVAGIAALTAFAPVARADRSMTCGNSLVRVGMTAPEVAAKCGEPKDKIIEQVPIQARTARGGTVLVGYTEVQRWTYDRGYGRFPAVLVFDDDKLKSIDVIARP